MRLKRPLILLDSVQELMTINLDSFQKKVLFLDADNTLFIPDMPLHEQELTSIINLLKKLKKQYTLVIISNNFAKDKAEFFADLGIETIFFAKKPLPFGFRKAKKQAEKVLGIQVNHQDILHIGDQFLTDGIGSILYNIDYILVNPIDENSDLIYAKPSRYLETKFSIRQKK